MTASGSCPPRTDAQAVLRVDLLALVENWRRLQALSGPAECAAVVKADAYGTGIEQVVPALARAGCRTFFTAHVSEGTRARASLHAAGFGAEVRLFVLNGFLSEAAPAGAYAAAGLCPVLCSLDQVADWVAAHGGASPPSALHVDTGMNRAGLSAAAAHRLTADQLRAAGTALLMSHLVSAEDESDPINATQVSRFEALRHGPLASLPASLANSSGIFLPQRPHHDLVRPGYALYGGNPTPGRPNPMRPVVSLAAPILQIRDVPAGERVGYGGRWTAHRPSRIATIGIGYADGLPRNARTTDNEAGPVATLGGVPCRLVGRVSMDLSLVDVTDADPALAKAGAPLTLLDETLTVDDLGDACNTIGYEILTRLGARYTRLYPGA